MGIAGAVIWFIGAMFVVLGLLLLAQSLPLWWKPGSLGISQGKAERATFIVAGIASLLIGLVILGLFSR